MASTIQFRYWVSQQDTCGLRNINGYSAVSLEPKIELILITEIRGFIKDTHKVQRVTGLYSPFCKPFSPIRDF